MKQNLCEAWIYIPKIVCLIHVYICTYAYLYIHTYVCVCVYICQQSTIRKKYLKSNLFLVPKYLYKSDSIYNGKHITLWEAPC